MRRLGESHAPACIAIAREGTANAHLRKAGVGNQRIVSGAVLPILAGDRCITRACFKNFSRRLLTVVTKIGGSHDISCTAGCNTRQRRTYRKCRESSGRTHSIDVVGTCPICRIATINGPNVIIGCHTKWNTTIFKTGRCARLRCLGFGSLRTIIGGRGVIIPIAGRTTISTVGLAWCAGHFSADCNFTFSRHAVHVNGNNRCTICNSGNIVICVHRGNGLHHCWCR